MKNDLGKYIQQSNYVEGFVLLCVGRVHLLDDLAHRGRDVPLLLAFQDVLSQRSTM